MSLPRPLAPSSKAQERKPSEPVPADVPTGSPGDGAALSMFLLF